MYIKYSTPLTLFFQIIPTFANVSAGTAAIQMLPVRFWSKRKKKGKKYKQVERTQKKELKYIGYYDEDRDRE